MLWTLSAVAVAIGIVLLMPIRARAWGTVGDDEFSGAAELCWGPDLVRVRIGSEEAGRIHVLGLRSFPLPTSSKPDAKPTPEARERTQTWLRLRRTDPRVVWGMARRAWRAVHPHLAVRGRVGVADPADAATVRAAVGLVARMASDGVEVDLRNEPFETTTALHGRVGVWIVPAEILGILAAWMIRPATRRALRGP